jgi:Tol biopolymer transport system component
MRSTIGRVSADGSSIDTLFPNPDNMQCVGPSWSHDGRKVAYAKFAWIVDGYYLNIFYHEFATGKEYQITWQKGEARTPAWSPDDKRVLFIARPDFSSPSKLYWMNVDGSAQTVLAASSLNCGYPDW